MDEAIEDYIDNLDMREQVEQLTRGYGQWSATIELRIPSALGVDVVRTPLRKLFPYMGRGQPWRIEKVKWMQDTIELQRRAWSSSSSFCWSASCFSLSTSCSASLAASLVCVWNSALVLLCMACFSLSSSAGWRLWVGAA